MSILKDLDPQYAKLHEEPSRQKPFVWISGALLILGCAYWMTLHLPAKGMAKDTPEPVAIKPTKQAPAHELASKEPIQDSAAKLPATAPVATIRDTRTSEPQQTSGSLIQDPLRENLPRSLADTEYRKPPQAAKSHANKGDPDSPPSPSKTENARHKTPTSLHAGKTEKSQGNNGKKANERDVDIITAIVR